LTTRGRAFGAAAAVVIVVGAALLAFQPIGSPWWTGGDADSVYVGSGLSLMGGNPTRYFDHPGIPLQQLLAATLEARWLVDGHGTRAEQSTAWFENLDTTRSAFRGWAIVFYFGSALALAAIVGLAFRDARAAAAGGLLFLGAPQVALYAIEFRPDVVIGPLSAAAVALLVAAVRRRSGLLYLAAAALIGFTITVKLHAIGLLLPLAVALALGRPAADWAARELPAARTWLRRHRRTVIAFAVTWLVLVVLLNIGSAGSPRAKAAGFIVATLALLACCWAVARFAPRRVRGLATLLAAMVVAALAGFVLPNLFFAGTVPTMARWVAAALVGRGVNSDAAPLSSGLTPLEPWAPYAVLALIGTIRGLRAGDRTLLIWASGALAMAGLAAARFATPHYFIPAVALAIPLVLRAVATPGRKVPLLAFVVVAAILVVPFRHGIREGRDAKGLVTAADRLDVWADDHLRNGEVGLTTVPDGDTTYRAYILQFATQPPQLDYRLYSADADGAAAARAAGKRIHYIVDPGRQVDVASLGLRRVGPAPGAPKGIDVVTPS
jgi:hypothetical protein